MITLRTAPRVLAFAALAVMFAAAARAPRHTKLLKSEPGANDTVTTAPKQVALYFSEKPDLKVAKFKLSDAQAAAVTLGAVKLDEATKGTPVIVPVTGKIASGTYTFDWSVAADDGHPTKGTFKFVVK